MVYNFIMDTIFRKRLKQLRLNKNLSQNEIAGILNITSQRYNNYERGRRFPDYDILLDIASYYNVTCDYLLGKSNSPIPNDNTAYVESHTEAMSVFSQLFELILHQRLDDNDTILLANYILQGLHATDKYMDNTPPIEES